MLEILKHSLLDSVVVLPFLLLVYVLIEVIEHTAASKISARLLKGKLSPLIGAGVGVIPQCGFGVVATKLYTNRSIALGTLLAVYISTSDEALAVLVSDFSAIDKLLPLLAIKVVFAIIVGYVVNFFVRKRELTSVDENISVEGCHHHVVGHDEDCGHCNREDEHKKEHRRNAINRFVWHPLWHTLITFLYIFAVNFIFSAIIHHVGENALASFMGKIEYAQPLLAAIIGLIPNCAASVVIAQMYAIGTLSLGAAVSGLCVSAGISLAVLFKENKSVKDSLTVLLLLFALSVMLGVLVTAVEALF